MTASSGTFRPGNQAVQVKGGASPDLGQHRGILTGHVRDLTVRAFLRKDAAWLTVYRLPGYAPELNPAEGLWGELKNGPLANLTARNLDEVTTAARHALGRVQYQPDLLNGFLAETGLATD
ncbi:transposase [Streptomyces hirsutus]|uniref:transposase n=1 Tax=Streptomyces hirsutus TaxID=35620 RepID=UPI00369E429F